MRYISQNRTGNVDVTFNKTKWKLGRLYLTKQTGNRDVTFNKTEWKQRGYIQQNKRDIEVLRVTKRKGKQRD